MKPGTGSDRASSLARRLDEGSAALIAVIEPIEPAPCQQLPKPGVWSIGKDAEHVADAAAYHHWIVRLTIGQKVSSHRPPIERDRMVSDLSPEEAVRLIRHRTNESRALLLRLTDDELDRTTRPARAGGEVLQETIERVLIGHYDVHRAAIQEKLRLLAGRTIHPRGR